MGFDYIMSVPLLPSCCDFFFVFGRRISLFGRFQSFSLMVVQQLVVFLVFSWEEVSSRSSTLPSYLLSWCTRLRADGASVSGVPHEYNSIMVVGGVGGHAIFSLVSGAAQ